MARRRVGPVKSVRLALSTRNRNLSTIGADDASVVESILVGIWWSIAGVPERFLQDPSTETS
jgi:hypothetical protein